MPRFFAFAVLLFATSIGFTATPSATITASISVASLPTTITLCRDPTAYADAGIDELFEVLIDIDNNPATGGTGGYDAVIQVGTDNSIVAPCNPTPTSTEAALQTGLGVWDANQGMYVDSGVTPTLTLDFVRSTMIVTVPADGPLSGISADSTVHVQAVAPYSSASGTNIAGDAATTFKYGNGAVDAKSDVQQCTAPCSQSAAYYPLIDLVGASLGDVIFRSSFE